MSKLKDIPPGKYSGKMIDVKISSKHIKIRFQIDGVDEIQTSTIVKPE